MTYKLMYWTSNDHGKSVISYYASRESAEEHIALVRTLFKLKDGIEWEYKIEEI